MTELMSEYALAISVAVMVVIACVFAVIFWGGKEAGHTANEFRTACSEVKGNAVWNGKYWECLR